MGAIFENASLWLHLIMILAERLKAANQALGDLCGHSGLKSFMQRTSWE